MCCFGIFDSCFVSQITFPEGEPPPFNPTFSKQLDFCSGLKQRFTSNFNFYLFNLDNTNAYLLGTVFYNSKFCGILFLCFVVFSQQDNRIRNIS